MCFVVREIRKEPGNQAFPVSGKRLARERKVSWSGKELTAGNGNLSHFQESRSPGKPNQDVRLTCVNQYYHVNKTSDDDDDDDDDDESVVS